MPGHHPSPSGRQLQNRATTGGYRIALVLITAMQLKHAPEQGRFAVTDQLSRFQRGALIERAVSHRPKPGRHTPDLPHSPKGYAEKLRRTTAAVPAHRPTRTTLPVQVLLIGIQKVIYAAVGLHGQREYCGNGRFWSFMARPTATRPLGANLPIRRARTG